MTRDEEIAQLQAQRKKALDSLTLLTSGKMRVFRGPSGGPTVDVTDSHKEREQELFNYLTERLRLLGIDDA